MEASAVGAPLREAQSEVARSLHRAIDALCSSPLVSSARARRVTGAPPGAAATAKDPDMEMVDRLVALCARETSKAALDEAGGELNMDEANAAVRRSIHKTRLVRDIVGVG